MRDWLSALGQSRVQNKQENINALIKMCNDYVDKMQDWITVSDVFVKVRLGEEAGILYQISPNNLAPRPQIVDEDFWSDIYPAMVGRMEWLEGVAS